MLPSRSPVVALTFRSAPHTVGAALVIALGGHKGRPYIQVLDRPEIVERFLFHQHSRRLHDHFRQ